MKSLFRLFVLLSFFFVTVPLSAQTVQQQGIVRKVTHSKSDPIVPVSGVQIVVGGVSSPKSNAQGDFSMPVQLTAEKSYVLQDVRIPKKSGYVLASPSRHDKLYYSKNKLLIALITPEEQASLSKETYNQLFRKYRKQGTLLIQQRNEIEDRLLDLQKGDAAYERLSHQLDSIQKLLSRYFDENNKRDITRELERIAEELTVTDYQSLDSVDARIYDLKRAGDWATLSQLLNRLMDGNAERYMMEQVDRKKAASAVSVAAQADVALRFRRVEEAIGAFKKRNELDSASCYYELLVQSDSSNWRYASEAAAFEMIYKADYSRAKQYVERALQLATTDSMKVISYCLSGDVLLETGQPAEALVYFNQALEQVRQTWGESHPAAARCYEGQGRVYVMQEKYNKAKKNFSKALEVLASSHRQIHPDCAAVYVHLGQMYEVKGDRVKSLETYQHAYQIYQQTVGTDHPFVLRLKQHISELDNRK